MFTEENYSFVLCAKRFQPDIELARLAKTLKQITLQRKESMQIFWPKSDIFVGYLDVFDCNYVGPRLLKISP